MNEEIEEIVRTPEENEYVVFSVLPHDKDNGMTRAEIIAELERRGIEIARSTTYDSLVRLMVKSKVGYSSRPQGGRGVGRPFTTFFKLVGLERFLNNA